MQVLGSWIDKPFLRLALIGKTRQSIEIISLKSLPLEKPEDVKQIYMPSFQGPVRSGLSAQDLLIRPIEIQGIDARHLEKVVAFQVEATTHFDPAEVLSVFHAGKKGTEATAPLLFTVPRQALREHLETLTLWKLDPDVVSAAPLALLRYALWKHPSQTDAFLVD